MLFNKSRTLPLACLLLALTWGAAAQAQTAWSLTGNSAGELQIGTGLPLPVGTAGIFLGGMTPATAGTAFWPPLLVPAIPGGGIINQNQTTAQGGKMTVPPGVLGNTIAGAPPIPIGVFTTNPAVFQVRTTISYAWPAATATFSPGGAPGIPGPTPVVFPGPPAAGGFITYGGGAKAFGGPAQFAIQAGPIAGTLTPPSKIPNGGTMGSKAPVATVWINAFGKLPASATKLGVVGASNPLGVAAPGAPGVTIATTMFGALTKGVAVGIGATPMGALTMSTLVTAGFPSNMVTATQGFPWTTGAITVSAPGTPPEIFFLSGTDMRIAGAGNVSLVSGALSQRALSKANANRGWLSLTLPEPTAALGAAAALVMLGICHGLVRRRSR